MSLSLTLINKWVARTWRLFYKSSKVRLFPEESLKLCSHNWAACMVHAFFHCKFVCLPFLIPACLGHPFLCLPASRPLIAFMSFQNNKIVHCSGTENSRYMKDMEPDLPVRYRGAENLKVRYRGAENLKVRYRGADII
jgi:hypothetical protein